MNKVSFLSAGASKATVEELERVTDSATGLPKVVDIIYKKLNSLKRLVHFRAELLASGLGSIRNEDLDADYDTIVSTVLEERIETNPSLLRTIAEAGVIGEVGATYLDLMHSDPTFRKTGDKFGPFRFPKIMRALSDARVWSGRGILETIASKNATGAIARLTRHELNRTGQLAKTPELNAQSTRSEQDQSQGGEGDQ